MADEYCDSYNSHDSQEERPDDLICPNCGSSSSSSTNHDSINVRVGENAGFYCLRCFANWISQHIPRMERIDLDG